MSNNAVFDWYVRRSAGNRSWRRIAVHASHHDRTLLNDGGKFVTIDQKHIPQGGTCRMDKDATIARVGAGAKPGTTRVRYAAGQVSRGGCPFLTTFDLPNADYAAARTAFLQMKDRAWKNVDQIKKDLGERWDKVTGKKK